MTLAVKICGINSDAAMAAAVAARVDYVGLMFYPPSPRYVTPALAATLAAGVPDGVCRVGVFVDADDDALAATIGRVGLDMLQLHGDESVERVMAVRERFALPVMKVIRVAGPEDIEAANDFTAVADWLLFDAHAPAHMKDALPGGNALSFDWRLLQGLEVATPCKTSRKDSKQYH